MRVQPIRRLVVALATAGALLSALAPVTSGTIAERESGTFTDAFSYPCGADIVDVTGSGTFNFMARLGKNKDDDAFFGHNRYDGRETHVRRSDGATFHLEYAGTFQEGRATRVSGSVFEFSAVDAFRIRVTDEDGNLLMFDRGSIRAVIHFDTLGDDEVGGEFVALIHEKFNGPHPLAVTEFCDLFD
ncbi:MAG TPA: hypothetical protein VFK54_11080 [Candidatus Limnocylindrales bacterium]|nr:hypothetical protein [Candidatus Limnocylindrales bacterium]